MLDNLPLLEKMTADMASGAALYRPTNYWNVYQHVFLPELRKVGLKDFRSRRGTILSKFGGTDYIPTDPGLHKVRLLNNRVTRNLPLFPSLLNAVNFRIGMSKFDKEPYRRLLDAAGTDWRKFRVSLVGNPEHTFELDGSLWTWDAVYRYLCLSYCRKFVDFTQIKTIVELGAGKQVELIKRFYPHITFLVFDICPQLYVSHQYLKNVFPDEFVDYRPNADLTLHPGKIHYFGSWQFPLLKGFDFDLFWNCVSFQEMEPEVVENYCSVISSKFAYLSERLEGKQVAQKAGDRGVLKPTLLEDYVRFLPNYNLINQTPHPMPTPDNETNMWFCRR